VNILFRNIPHRGAIMRVLGFVLLVIIVCPPFAAAQDELPDPTAPLWSDAERLAFIRQIGLHNLATILQTGSRDEQASQASIHQVMSFNQAHIEDHGIDNQITITQQGYAQSAAVDLRGDRNTETVTQIGIENIFSLLSGLNAEIGMYSQEGSGNELRIRKDAGVHAPLEIHQVGHGIRLIIE
jgi:hypothetical protein